MNKPFGVLSLKRDTSTCRIHEIFSFLQFYLLQTFSLTCPLNYYIFVKVIVNDLVYYDAAYVRSSCFMCILSELMSLIYINSS